MKNTKTIIYLLFFIFLIVMINTFSVIYLLQNNEIKNAYIINELGQIRGGIQRYSKLKIVNLEKEKIENVKKYIENKFKDVKNIYKDIIPNEAMEFFENNFYELNKNWNNLKKSKDIKQIYKLSEKSWEIADPLVVYIAKAMENKTQKILFFIIIISIISVLSTLISIFFIYDVISKNLRIKTLKDPISKLYNFYHLNETLETLQNRYQRYSKTFGLIKISLFEIDEKTIKDISKNLKNSIRRSDKIYHSKNTIVLILLEPEDVNINEYIKRVESLIKNSTKIKKIKYITYNGEKIEDFI
jgi:two-component system cell cycle response regulator